MVALYFYSIYDYYGETAAHRWICSTLERKRNEGRYNVRMSIPVIVAACSTTFIYYSRGFKGISTAGTALTTYRYTI